MFLCSLDWKPVQASSNGFLCLLFCVPLCGLWKFKTLIFIICLIYSSKQTVSEQFMFAEDFRKQLLMKCVYPCKIWKRIIVSMPNRCTQIVLMFYRHALNECFRLFVFQYRLWCYTMQHPKIEEECTVISTVKCWHKCMRLNWAVAVCTNQPCPAKLFCWLLCQETFGWD